MVRTKVFVGNLSFKTHEDGLAAAFEKAGKIVSAQIVSRGRRSLGYGFVEFENEESANKAIKELNKMKLDEREINVEMAKPRQEGGSQQQGPPRRSFNNRPYGGGRGGGRSGGYNSGYGRPYGGNFGNRRFNRGGRRFRGGMRQRSSMENRQPSNTSLFVTNLPFKYSDEDFHKIFTDAGLKVKSAKVARTLNGRSRGYGFVDLETNGEQQKALQMFDKKEVDGRELVVKVAMIDPSAQQQQQPAQPAQPKPAQPAQPPQQSPAKPVQPAQSPQQPAQPKATPPAQSPQQPAQPAPQQAQPAQPKATPPAQSPQQQPPAQPAQPVPQQSPAKPTPQQPAQEKQQSPQVKKK
jgi:RNA recognition motif-containing protein